MAVDWQRCISAFILDKGPFYIYHQPMSKVDKRKKYAYPESLKQYPLILSLTAYNPLNKRRRMVDNLLENLQLRKDLKNSQCIMDNCVTYDSFSYFANDLSHLERGFTVAVKEKSKECEDVIKNLVKKYKQAEYFRYITGEQWICQVVAANGVVQSEESVIPTESQLSSHPTFLCEENNPVYHSYGRAKCVLEQCISTIPEAMRTLDIAAKYIDVDVEELKSHMKYPLVVIEGMDATGKTTLTDTLGKHMKAEKLCTPPPCIAHLRQVFDQYPEFIRRAYYSMGNYIVAHEIAKVCRTKPVVMDRFWHSTAAYAIAHESGEGDVSVLPKNNHPVYNWPEDLLKPTAVLFLTVPEKIRNERLNLRNEKTWEEKHMSKSQLFRQRLLGAYRDINNPSCVEIDASPSKEEVAKLAFKTLHDLGIAGLDAKLQFHSA